MTTAMLMQWDFAYQQYDYSKDATDPFDFKDCSVNVANDISAESQSGGAYVAGYAYWCYFTLENCTVKAESIRASGLESDASGFAYRFFPVTRGSLSEKHGEIDGCKVVVDSISAINTDSAYTASVFGFVGDNYIMPNYGVESAAIRNCEVKINNELKYESENQQSVKVLFAGNNRSSYGVYGNTVILPEDQAEIVSLAEDTNTYVRFTGGEVENRARASMDDGSTWESGNKVQFIGEAAADVFCRYDDGDESKTLWQLKFRETVTITPLDIVLYTGGNGYDGVVINEEDGTFTDSGGENGFPEPGYLMELPEKINEKLTDNNLTGKLTFHYNDGAGTKREWNIELYSDGATSMDEGKNIYKIIPYQNGDTQIPVRLSIKDSETGTVVTSDTWDYSVADAVRTYTASIYSGDLDQGLITANLTVGEEVYDLLVETGEGNLTVYGTEEEVRYSSLKKDETSLTADEIGVIGNDSTRYYLNDTQVAVDSASEIVLLEDKLSLSNDAENVARDYAKANGIFLTDDTMMESRYLDLVDKNNGNAVVTLGAGDTVSVYWPVPGDYDNRTVPYMLHFKELHRGDSYTEYDASNIDCIELENRVSINGASYFKFDVSSFSPFVLLYEKRADDSDSKDPVNSGGTMENVPSTGDDSNFRLWTVLVVLSVSGLATLTLRSRRFRSRRSR